MKFLPRDYRMKTASGTSGGCKEKRGWLQVAHLGVEQGQGRSTPVGVGGRAAKGASHPTFPPETEPLDDSRRADHVRWRLEALAEARRELARTVRGRWLRRAVTLGVWWR